MSNIVSTAPQQRRTKTVRAAQIAIAGGVLVFGTNSAQAQSDGRNYTAVESLDGVASSELQANGSVRIVMEDGRTVLIDAANVQLVDGVILVEANILADALAATAAAGGGAGLALGGLAAGGLVAGLAGGAGGGGSDDGGSQPVPPPPGNAAPVFTSASSNSAEENSSGAAYTAVATDADGDTLSYSLSGTDAALFAIDATTGEVSFIDAPDFEAPLDADSDNAYEIVVIASDGTASTTRSVTVTVTNVNDVAPEITSAATVSVAENTDAVIYTAAATDADGDTITYALSGTDAALFSIDAATGEVTFIDAPDFEAPADADGDNVYDVTITASDGTSSDNQAVSITVTNENDNAPVVTSASAVSVAENGTGVVYTAAATDADGDTVTYALSGTDAALFSIDAATGEVSFVDAPDFETPADADGDNVYDVTVTASDGTSSDNQAVSITVTNENDNAPVVTSSAAVTFAENATGTAYTAAATDADGDIVSYALSGTDAALFSIDAATGEVSFVDAPDFEAPADADSDNVYDVTITASDGTNTTDQVVAITVTNENDNAPVVTSASAVSVAENGTGVVYTAAATDADGDTITYALSGTDAALFTIDATTGEVTFIDAPDFETPADADGDNVYDVTVTASDGTSSDNQAVSITVTNENDNAPVVTSSAAVTFAENATGTAYTAAATDADGDTVTYALSGTDAALFSIDAATGEVSFIDAPDFEAPADADGDNVYELTVTASDGANTTDQAVSITVTNENDNAPVVTSSAAVTFAENATGTAYTAAATDADEDTVTYSLSGTDAALFTIDAATGEVTFIDAPDFEAPADADSDNVYDVTITASDGTNTTEQVVAITVTNENDNAPEFTVASSLSAVFPGTLITEIVASDLDGDVLSYSLSGPDTSRVSIDVNTGELRLLSRQSPSGTYDADGNSRFEVTVHVTDGTNTTSQSVVISISRGGEFTATTNGPPITGSEFNDQIIGTTGNDTLIGAGGEDYLFGSSGDDMLDGGDGNDTLSAGYGSDTVHGGDGDDILSDQDGGGRLYGGAGNDLISSTTWTYGSDEHQILDGGTGDDQISYTANLATTTAEIIGGEGNDVVSVYGLIAGGEVVIDLGDGNDLLWIGSSTLPFDSGLLTSTVTLGAGRDMVVIRDEGGTITITDFETGENGDGLRLRFTGDINGADWSINPFASGQLQLIQRGADSVLQFDTTGAGGWQDLVVFQNTDTTDFVAANFYGYTLDGGLEPLDFSGTSGDDQEYGSVGNDTMSGGAGNDTLAGYEGDDVILGGDGDDVLAGGFGNDRVEGGDGNDQLFASAGSVAETDEIHGQAGNDVLTVSGGSAAFDVTATGGDGNDMFTISGGSATVLDLDAGAGVDSVYLRSYLGGASTINLGSGDDNLVIDGRSTLAGTHVVTLGEGSDTIDLVQFTQGSITVTDFTAGDGGDIIRFHDVGGAYAFTDRRVLQDNDDTLLQVFDSGDWVTFLVLEDVLAADLTIHNFDGDTPYIVGTSEVTIDGATLTAEEGFIINGARDPIISGVGVVSDLGDINGDGLNDISAGNYVVFGSTSGFGSTDSSGRQAIGTNTISPDVGFVVIGGNVAAGSGDFNGDGIADLLVGNSVTTYVVFGSTEPLGTLVPESTDWLGLVTSERRVLDVTALTPDQGFAITGFANPGTPRELADRALSNAGDVNGDGIDDLLIGASDLGEPGSQYGAAFVVYGSTTAPGSVVGGEQTFDLSDMNSSQGFMIQGDTEQDYFADRVSGAGDVNGDGYADIIIGASGGHDGGSYSGEAYIVFGSATGVGTTVDGGQVVNISTLSASQGFIIQGDAAGDFLGQSVSGAGDLNGDGYDDLIIGAPEADDGGVSAGEAYVLWGSGTGFGTDVGGRQVVDLTTLSASEGFIIQGDAGYDELGWSVSSAGDVNGDGYEDLIVGAIYADGEVRYSGAAYVVFGGEDGFGTQVDGRQVLDLSRLSAEQGFRIGGDEPTELVGRSVSGAGDINGDGFDDVIVSAPLSDSYGADYGSAYVIFGGVTGPINAVTTAGTAAADSLVGSAGHDILTGNGGADVLRGGAGDDVLAISDAGFFRIDGGNGDDTLRIDGAGVDLDLTALSQNAITDIERIDLTGSGDNSLTLTRLDLFDMVDARADGIAVLRVTGDAGDTVTLDDGTDWSAGDPIVDDGITYDVYTNGNAEIRIEAGVAVTLSGVPTMEAINLDKIGTQVMDSLTVPDTNWQPTDTTPDNRFGLFGENDSLFPEVDLVDWMTDSVRLVPPSDATGLPGFTALTDDAARMGAGEPLAPHTWPTMERAPYWDSADLKTLDDVPALPAVPESVEGW